MVDIPGEKIKTGDEVQIRKNNAIDNSKTQDIRTVTEIIESDTVRTSIYTGQGDLDTIKPRPVAWDKQKRDVFIYGEPISKSRDSLESIIRPDAAIIKTFQPTDTEILLSNADLYEYESEFGTIISSISARAYNKTAGVPVELNVIMNGSSVSSVQILNPTTNSGYSSGDTIRFNASPIGQRAQAILLVSGGRVVGVNVTNGGGGYTTAPSYVISNPSQVYEDIGEIQTIQGWGAIITQITATNSGPFNNSIVFEYRTVDPVVFSSDLQPGYRIALTNTFVGNGVQAYGNNGGDLVAVGTNFLNCVYHVAAVTSTASGGTVRVNVSGTTDLNGINSSGDNLGSFSWGRATNLLRENPEMFMVDPIAYDDQFTNYPSLMRRSEGLRNRGGLGKEP